MAKFHVQLVTLRASTSGVTPIQNIPAEEEQIIDTAVSEASTIYPKRGGLYWIITPIDGDGWVGLGAEGNPNAAPLPVAALEDGFPVFEKTEKAVVAPPFRRIAIKAVVA